MSAMGGQLGAQIGSDVKNFGQVNNPIYEEEEKKDHGVMAAGVSK